MMDHSVDLGDGTRGANSQTVAEMIPCGVARRVEPLAVTREHCAAGLMDSLIDSRSIPSAITEEPIGPRPATHGLCSCMRLQFLGWWTGPAQAPQGPPDDHHVPRRDPPPASLSPPYSNAASPAPKRSHSDGMATGANSISPSGTWHRFRERWTGIGKSGVPWPARVVRRARRNRSQQASTRSAKAKGDPKVIRAWATENGIAVPAHGRNPVGVERRYNEVNRPLLAAAVRHATPFWRGCQFIDGGVRCRYSVRLLGHRSRAHRAQVAELGVWQTFATASSWPSPAVRTSIGPALWVVSVGDIGRLTRTRRDVLWGRVCADRDCGRRPPDGGSWSGPVIRGVAMCEWPASRPDTMAS